MLIYHIEKVNYIIELNEYSFKMSTIVVWTEEIEGQSDEASYKTMYVIIDMYSDRFLCLNNIKLKKREHNTKELYT